MMVISTGFPPKMPETFRFRNFSSFGQMDFCNHRSVGAQISVGFWDEDEEYVFY